MAETPTITKRSTMQEILEAYPSAQRALFQRYHIGGCHSCGYEPNDILEEVANRHGITDLDPVLRFIEEADQADKRVQVSPEEVASLLKGGEPPRLIDVRLPAERELARIEGSVPITEELAREIMGWPKETPMVFYCHVGSRSLDAASYFAGHGFLNARSMTGGIEAWSRTVDPSVPRYEVARDLSSGRPVFRPLRSVVSQAEGCMTTEKGN
jgi:rhodanese-related sulfurtransferase